ncbi:hypothetical protein QBZ16_000674 [Prototheca wickerhamii]|uniref:Pre-mRNA-processing factor 19 n=1 Tax=Prototheca wickerhamii TaxID=3111 RepID=A0AAD9MM94_PROWI|nr:hypothetical protein QBZ16_000674 [Prototheca wickerhamii]
MWVTVATPEEVAALRAAGSFPLHKTRKGGIEALALAPDAPGLVASAGGDGSVQLYDVTATRSVAELLGHTKRVTGVAFAGSARVVLSASADHTVRVWRAADEGYAQAAAVDAGAEVVAVAAHPTCPYAVSAAADGSWALDDVEEGARLATVRDEEAAAYSTAALHPDGLILVTGTTEGAVRVWETRTQKRVAAFGEHSGAIAGVSFSENGYHMATAAADGVRLWDLRKLKNFATLTPFGENVPATCVSFDHSGLYLAVGGPEGTHAVRFGPDAKSLLVGASDHNLRYFTL